MSIDVSFTRDSQGCPRPPQVTGSWIIASQNSRIDNVLPNGNTVIRTYDVFGMIEGYWEHLPGGYELRFWIKSNFGVGCAWIIDGKWFSWGNGFVDECGMRNGRCHGLQHEWEVGFGHSKLVRMNLRVRGRVHNSVVWMGQAENKALVQERLPRAGSLTAVLPLSVARRVISFL